ncbi:MAG: gluconeogenesis factor YvcK family protein [Patescibacteria group bacterium]
MKKHKIIIIGGGTGTFTALLGLKRYPVSLSAIVTMMDDGGSSGTLRDELGVLPPGDIRQCIIALAKSTRLLRELFDYRYSNGVLKGHTFGNIFISTLEKQSGSLKKAIKVVGDILNIRGKVIPVTYGKSTLCVQLDDGKIIKGEHHIDVSDNIVERDKIQKAFLLPKPKPNEDAITAIKKSDYILIGPGDLYTSVIPNLLVPRIASAIKKSKAKKIYVLNIMTKFGQTTKYTAKDHLNDLEKYLGKGVIDIVLLNSEKPSNKALAWYKNFKEVPVVDDIDKSNDYKVYSAKLIKDLLINGSKKGDELRRSIIRHDPHKLAKKILDIIGDNA